MYEEGTDGFSPRVLKRPCGFPEQAESLHTSGACMPPSLGAASARHLVVL